MHRRNKANLTIRKVKEVIDQRRVLHVNLLLTALLFSLFLGACAELPSVIPPPNLTPAPAQDVGAPAGTEILWDTWGVPHIYADEASGLFYGFGWAQAKSHGDLLLRLYGQARGRAAEYWGEDFVDTDRTIRVMGLYDEADEWYAAQNPTFQRYLDAFAAGVNAYVRANPNQVADDVEVVLPITAVDVIAHTRRVFFEFQTGSWSGCGAAFTTAISNAWAIAPTHAANDNAMLLANPHLPWFDLYLFYEAQLSGPGYSAYGTTLVGFPVLAIGFNDHLGWTHTVNTIDTCDLYELTPANDGYRFDGEVREFEEQIETLRVRQADGTVAEQDLIVRQSVHGPVVERDGRLVAVRIAGIDQDPAYGLLEQWWNMGRAGNLAEFEAAVKRLQLPMFNIIYADADGHIMYLDNGRIPVRPTGGWDYWTGVVPGATSATLWTNVHPYEDLPKVIDPESGWVQNSNSPPWFATVPAVIEDEDYPPYLAPEWVGFREQRGISMLQEDASISLDELVQYKMSTRLELADRVLDELLAAARASGSEMAQVAAEVLADWDRQANADSRGAVLFLFWVQAMRPRDMMAESVFATVWDETAPLTTPSGLADPEQAVAVLEMAASQVADAFGALDVAWGDVFRLRRGDVDLPASGGPGDPLGIFRVVSFAPAADGRFESGSGDTFIAAVEFSDPVQARVLLTYGNATQAGSPHIGDQLPLYARDELRPAWLTRDAVEANLEARDEF
jgi:acyl-homoserine-lactone acylase